MKIRTPFIDAHRPQVFLVLVVVTVLALAAVASGCSSQLPAKDESQNVMHNPAVPEELRQPRGTTGTSTTLGSTNLPPRQRQYYEDPLPPRTEPFAMAMQQADLQLGQWYCRHSATSTGIVSVYLVAGPFNHQDARPGQYYLIEQRLGGSSGEQTMPQVELASSLGVAPDADGTWNAYNWLTPGKCPQKEEDTPPAPITPNTPVVNPHR